MQDCMNNLAKGERIVLAHTMLLHVSLAAVILCLPPVFFKASLPTVYSPMILLRVSTSRTCFLVARVVPDLATASLPPSRNFSFYVYTVLGDRLCSRHSSVTLVSGLNVCSTMRIFSFVLHLVFCQPCGSSLGTSKKCAMLIVPILAGTGPNLVCCRRTRMNTEL